MAVRLRDALIVGTLFGILWVAASWDSALRMAAIEKRQDKQDAERELAIKANSNRLAASIQDSLRAIIEREHESLRRSAAYDRDKIIDSVRAYNRRR